MRFESQKGVGMIEVLVSLLLLAISILGFVALQVRSVEASSESLVRTYAIQVMRGLGESIRYNSAAKNDYQTALNQFDTDFNAASAPANIIVTKKPTTGDCGLMGSAISSTPATGTSPAIISMTTCSRTNQANIDAYFAAKNAFENGFRLRMDDCPNQPASGVMQTKCLIAAWNNTTATFAENADVDCMSRNTGTYHRKAECMILELL